MKNRAICRRCSVVLALVMVIWLSPAALAAVPDRPDNKYVLDTARVLSEGTERRIIAENQELFEECGGEIVVVAVDFLGGQDIEDYTYKMFNSWGVGSQERNNGILLVLAIGEENYYIQAGYGIEDYFDTPFLSDILEEQLEPDFAAGDYDAGVKKTFDALISELRSYYDSGPGREAPAPGQEYDYSDEDWDEDWGFSGLRELKTIAFALVRVVVIVAVLLFVFSLFRGSGGSGPRGGGGGGGFWRGMWLGSMLNGRRRTYWGPPPPPPPPGGHRPGGFGGFGGFGGGSRGGFSGGGRSHGGGAGRGFGGGGGFHGGGGSHGGGAGRR